MQKTYWRSRTSCRKLWWLDYSRSQSSQWRLWISKQSLICSRVARLGHTMNPVVYRARKPSQETQRSLQKFLESDGNLEVIYTDNSLEFGKACEDLYWNHCTSTPHRSETNGIAESSAQSERRDICVAVAIRSAWKLVGRFYGMLHLSAKRHRSIVWWEDALWKTFWATI